MNLQFKLNGKQVELDCEAADTLAEVLRRRLGLRRKPWCR